MNGKISWKMDTQVAGATLLVISEVPNFLAGALPSFMTIKKFAADEEAVQTLRYAEAFALVPIAASGVGITFIFGSWWPLLLAGVTAIYYYYGYEKHIRNPSQDAVSINESSSVYG